MTRSEDHGGQRRREAERNGRLTAGDALIVYERDDTSRWLQSDTVVSLAEMR